MGDGKVGGKLRVPDDHSALLGRIAHELLGWRQCHHSWIPSDEADVFELTADGHAPRIVKVERDGAWCVRREELAFPAMPSLGFSEFPEVEFATAALDSAARPFIVMPKTNGRPWPDLWAEDRRLAVWVTDRVGDFLRRLAAVDWRQVPGVVTPDERVGGFENWFARFFAPLLDHPMLAASDRARIDECLAAMREPPAAFGGWQFAQVLTDGRSTFVAIDWGNLGAYWPLHDLAAAVCSLEAFAVGADELLRPHLLDAFTGGRGLSSTDETLLTLWLDLWDFFGRAAELHMSRA